MLKKWLLSALAIPFLVCGCISFEYEGKSGGVPTENIRVYQDAAKVKRSYEVLGKATVSANYSEVDRDKMLEKLTAEAEERGADAVLLVEQQVVPLKQHHVAPKYNTGFDLENESSSWARIQKDVDLNYGNIRSKAQDVPKETGYRRVIKAEFLKFSGTPDAE